MTDWNQHRGDRRNSGRRTNLEGPDRLEEQWSADLAGPVSASPVVDRDVVYVGTERGHLYAFDAAEHRAQARRRWVFEAPSAVAGTPVVTSAAVFLATTDGDVYALDPATGDRRWEYSATGPLESSLALADGTLVVGEATGLSALEADTGEKRWTHETDAPVVGCPAIADARARDVREWGWDHDRVYVGTRDETLCALELDPDLEAEREAWSVPTDGTIVGGPTIANGRVYTADDAGTMLALDADTGQSWFATQTDTAFTSAVTVVDDVAFTGGADGYLHVLETTFGKRKLSGLLFSKKGVSVDGPVCTDPVVAGDVLCVGDASGTLYGIALEDDRFAEFAWHRVTERTPVYTPAIAPERLYVAFDDARLSCLSWRRD